MGPREGLGGTASPGAVGRSPGTAWRAVSASALTGAGAERQGDAPPGVEVRGRGRQVEGDAAHRNDDVGAQLQQPVAQPCHLGAGTPGTRRAQQEFLHQHVGRGGDEHAELIRPEATAARAVDLEAVSEGSAASDGCVRGIRRQRWLCPRDPPPAMAVSEGSAASDGCVLGRCVGERTLR